MTLETAKQSIGCSVTVNGTKGKITHVDSFGGVPHFYVEFKTSEGWRAGWVACDLAGQAEY